MQPNSKMYERVAVVATIDPDAYGTGAQNTDVIDMRMIRKVLFVIMAGTLGTDATLAFEVRGDTASNGSFTTKITGKEITTLTETGTDSDKQAIVEVSSEEVILQGFRYIRGVATLAAATSDYGVVALGGDTQFMPATEYDLASVAETV